jgi:hypothetical protein
MGTAAPPGDLVCFHDQQRTNHTTSLR